MEIIPRTIIVGARIFTGRIVTFAAYLHSSDPHIKIKKFASTSPKKRVQRMSWCLVKSSNPGFRPWIIIPPINMAATPPPGIPRVSVGMRAPATHALFEASGAMTPSGTPVPKLSGFFEARVSAR